MAEILATWLNEEVGLSQVSQSPITVSYGGAKRLFPMQ